MAHSTHQEHKAHAPRSDQDGRFSLPIPANHPCRVAAAASEHEPAGLELAALATQPDADRLPLTLRAHDWQTYGGLRFPAVDEKGAPVTQGVVVSTSLFSAREPRVSYEAARGESIAYTDLAAEATCGPKLSGPACSTANVVLGPRRTLEIGVDEVGGHELPAVLGVELQMARGRNARTEIGRWVRRHGRWPLAGSPWICPWRGPQRIPVRSRVRPFPSPRSRSRRRWPARRHAQKRGSPSRAPRRC